MLIYVLDYYKKDGVIFSSFAVGGCFGKWTKYPEPIFKKMVQDIKQTPDIELKLRKLEVAQ